MQEPPYLMMPKTIYFINAYVYVFMCTMYVQVTGLCNWQGTEFSELQVVVNSLNIDAWNWTQVLLKSIKCS